MRHYTGETHVAQMIGLLEHPPPQALGRIDSEIYTHLFDSQGGDAFCDGFLVTTCTVKGEFQFPELIPREKCRF